MKKDVNFSLNAILSVIFGFGAALVRGYNQYEFSLTNEYFFQYNNLSILAFVLFCISIFFVFANFIFMPKNYDTDFVTAFKCRNSLALTSIVTSAFLLAVTIFIIFASASIFYLDFFHKATTLVYVIFTLCTILSFFICVKAQASAEVNSNLVVFFNLPLYWICYHLIIVFKDNNSNPIIFDFIFIILALVSLMYTFYMFAAFLFAKAKPKTFCLVSLVAITLVFLEIMPNIFIAIANQTFITIDFAYTISLLACAIFVLTQNLIITNNLYIRKEQHYEP